MEIENWFDDRRLNSFLFDYLFMLSIFVEFDARMCLRAVAR